MGISPAADAEESFDFSFSMAYDSALPLSPSSPTPLRSTAWRTPALASAQPSSDRSGDCPVPQLQTADDGLKEEAPVHEQIHCLAGQRGRPENGAAPNQHDPPPVRGSHSGASTSKEPSSEAEPLSLKPDQRTTSATSVPDSSKANSAGQSSIRIEALSQVAEGSPQEIGPKTVAATKTPVHRMKVPYEKGFSQMDWLRLTRTHPDLAGLKGGPKRRIKMEEVQLHKSEDDSWTVLKGKVFNITPYFNFHPGGKKMLRLAAGKDCTELFNKYHMWVNAEFLLEKCWLGILDID